MNIVDDCVRNELVQNNYGIEYPNHLRELKKSFEAGNLKVPRLEDKDLELSKNSEMLLNCFYEDAIADLDSVAFAHLDTSAEAPRLPVFLSMCDSPQRFWIQNEYSNKLLISLNADINAFMRHASEKQAEIESSIWEISRG